MTTASVPAPRYRLNHPAPGCMCSCGHREGVHNDIGRCTTWNCSCGGFPHAPREMWGGFDPVDGPCSVRLPALSDPKEEQNNGE